MAATLSAITDNVHFAYTDLVNWTLVADDDGVLLIDAGFPGSRDDVLASLRKLGFGVDDLRAILLTHAHIDHFGSAIWFAKTHGTPVYCHAAEVGHSKREYLEQASPVDIAKHIWAPRYLTWSVAISRKGALTREGIPTTRALTEEVAARPARQAERGSHAGPYRRALLVHRGRGAGQRRRLGHRPSAGTAHRPATAARLFNHDEDGCVRSLAALGLLDTEVLLPGHGPVWRGSIREAAEEAQAIASRMRRW